MNHATMPNDRGSVARALLTNLRAAADELGPSNDTSASLNLSLYLVERIEADLDNSGGGIPEISGPSSRVSSENLHWADASAALSGQYLLDAIEVLPTLTRTLPGLTGARLIELVMRIVNSAVASSLHGPVRALPSQSVPIEPFYPAKQRSWEPQLAYHTLSTSSMVDLCARLEKLGELDGVQRVMAEEMVQWLESLESDADGNYATFYSMHDGKTPVFGTEDGADVFDESAAYKGRYRWRSKQGIIGALKRWRARTPDPPKPTGTIAFYNFGGSGTDPETGHNRRLEQAGTWPAWAQSVLDELPKGVRRVWLHNPFGLWEKDSDGRMMWPDQWKLAQVAGVSDHMTDGAAFVEAMHLLRKGGVEEIIAYVGSPLTIESPTLEKFVGMIQPLIEADCSIGLDATYDWRKGDAIDRIIQPLREAGHRVYVEPYLLGDRAYGEIDGVVYLDRFVDSHLSKGRIGDIPIADPLPASVERVVIQRSIDAAALKQLQDGGATIAVRLWSKVGQEVAG